MLMFDYTKLVLQKVSFDRSLFKKELSKSLNALQPSERQSLKIWCIATFTAYTDIVIEVFRKYSS
ncbi:MAG: hypothetical protein RL021_1484 [Bacteroidota bacterium]